MTQDLLSPSDDQVTLDENKNYLEELVGENKKFKTPEELAKGKFASDHYIQTLERRLDEMREDYMKVRDEYNAVPKLQELIDRLDEQNLTSRKTNQDSNEDTNKPGYDPKEVESLISNKIQQNEQLRKEEENFSLVQNKVKERYGASYTEVLKQKADTLGLNDKDINSLARTNPNLFFKTFDVNEPRQNESFQSPPRSERRSDNFAPKGSEKRTMSYYENLRKSNPKIYFDPKIAVQMDKDSQLLKEAFFDT